jgi:hypothetical protein
MTLFIEDNRPVPSGFILAKSVQEALKNVNINKLNKYP